MGYSEDSEPRNPGYCPKCYAVIPRGQSTCTRCHRPVEREGLLSRIAKRLFAWAARSGIVKIDGLSCEEGPVVRQRVFKSWDELPGEVAAKMEQARQSGNTLVQLRDNITGREETFRSWDDVPDDFKRRLPPDLAARIEQARQAGGRIIRFRGGTTGEHRTFASWDEVPEALKDKIPAEIRRRMAAELEGAFEDPVPAEVGPDEIVVQQAITSEVLDFEIQDMRFGG